MIMKISCALIVLAFGLNSFAAGTAKTVKAASSRNPASVGEKTPYPIQIDSSCHYISKDDVDTQALTSQGQFAWRVYGEEALFCAQHVETALTAAGGHPAIQVPKKVDSVCNLIAKNKDALGTFKHSCSSERYAYHIYDSNILFCCELQTNY